MSAVCVGANTGPLACGAPCTAHITSSHVQGFMDIAMARYSLGSMVVCQYSFNPAMKALARVAIPVAHTAGAGSAVHEAGDGASWQVLRTQGDDAAAPDVVDRGDGIGATDDRDAYGGPAKAASAEGVRQRRATRSMDTEGVTADAAPAVARPLRGAPLRTPEHDPLRWFGVVANPRMKAAQGRFKQGEATALVHRTRTSIGRQFVAAHFPRISQMTPCCTTIGRTGTLQRSWS